MQRDTRSLVIARLQAAGGEMQKHELTAALRYRADGAVVLRQLIVDGTIEKGRSKAGLLGRRATTYRLRK